MPLRIASLSSLESPNHYILQNPLISGSKGGSLQKTTYNHFESPMCTVPRSPMCTVPKSCMCILPLKPYSLNKVCQSTMQIFYLCCNNFVGKRNYNVIKNQLSCIFIFSLFTFTFKRLKIIIFFINFLKKPSLHLYFSKFFKKYVSDWWKVP